MTNIEILNAFHGLEKRVAQAVVNHREHGLAYLDALCEVSTVMQIIGTTALLTSEQITSLRGQSMKAYAQIKEGAICTMTILDFHWELSVFWWDARNAEQPEPRAKYDLALVRFARIAARGPEFAEIYAAWLAHVNDGAKRPEAPQEAHA